MKYSDYIDDFLTFLRNASSEYSIATLTEHETNDKIQDILHDLELSNSNGYHDYAKLGKALREIRLQRREAKDKCLHLQPIMDWMEKNQQAIKDMEQLLGSVRKAERGTEGRTYHNRTDVIAELFNPKED